MFYSFYSIHQRNYEVVSAHGCRQLDPAALLVKALTALAGRLSLSVGWENGPEPGLKAGSFNP